MAKYYPMTDRVADAEVEIALRRDAAAYLAACNAGRPEDAAVAAEGHDRDAFRAALAAADWPTPPAAEARGGANPA